MIAAKGFNRNWPIPLRYGKHKYCGLEILDWKVEQHLRRIKFMRKLFLHKRHKILIQSIIEWYQLTAGVEESILIKPNNRINYTSSIWFQDKIDFLYKHNITIEKWWMYNGENTSTKPPKTLTNKNKFISDVLTSIPSKWRDWTGW